MEKPRLIEFPKIGESSEGFISISESKKNVPFEMKRIFWTYYTPDNIVRGRHAHYETEMILLAVAGRIIVNTEMPGNELSVFVLENPNVGLYIPKLCWHTMQYAHSSVQLVITNTFYDEKDYIMDYEAFKQLKA